MSQQQPEWGPPQQPHPPGAPPFGPPPPPRKRSTGKIIGFVALGVVALVVVLGVIGFAVSGDGDGDDGRLTTKPSRVAEQTPDAPDADDTADDAAKGDGKAGGDAKEDGKGEPKPADRTSFTDGDYVVGEDIPAGSYESAGAKKGLFEFCSVMTEPTDASTIPKIKTADAGERILITLVEADGTVSIQGCEPLTKR